MFCLRRLGWGMWGDRGFIVRNKLRRRRPGKGRRLAKIGRMSRVGTKLMTMALNCA